MFIAGLVIVLAGAETMLRGASRVAARLRVPPILIGLTVVSIGTTSVFPYIAGPVVWAARQGVPTVEINPDDTTVSGIVDHHLRMSAAEALPELWLRMHPRDPAED